MKLWMNGESHVDVYDALFATRKEVVALVNQQISKKNYGRGLKSWDIIPIIMPAGSIGDYPEVAEYDPKTRECEFRLHVNFSRFKKGPANIRRKLIFDMLRRSLDYLQKWEVDNFDIVALRQDFETVVAESK